METNTYPPVEETHVQPGFFNRLPAIYVYSIQNSAFQAEHELLAASLIPRPTGSKIVKPKPAQRIEDKAKRKKESNEVNDISKLLALPEVNGATESVISIITLLTSHAHEFRFSHQEESGNVLWYAPTLQFHIAGDLKYGEKSLHEEIDANKPVLIAIGTASRDRKVAGDLGESLIDLLSSHLNLRDEKIKSKTDTDEQTTNVNTVDVQMSPDAEHIIGSILFPNLAKVESAPFIENKSGTYFSYHGKRTRTDRKYEGMFHIKGVGEGERDIIVLIARKPLAEGSTRFASKGFINISPQEQIEI